jgi:hypothetical protein
MLAHLQVVCELFITIIRFHTYVHVVIVVEALCCIVQRAQVMHEHQTTNASDLWQRPVACSSQRCITKLCATWMKTMHCSHRSLGNVGLLVCRMPPCNVVRGCGCMNLCVQFDNDHGRLPPTLLSSRRYEHNYARMASVH